MYSIFYLTKNYKAIYSALLKLNFLSSCHSIIVVVHFVIWDIVTSIISQI